MLRQSMASDARQKRGSLEAYLMLVGLCLLIVCSSQFVLFEYYGGGVLEYRGQMAEMDRRFPDDVDYALFQRGRATPLSAKQYRFLTSYERISEACGIVGLIVWSIGCLLVFRRTRSEPLRNGETGIRSPTPLYVLHFMLFKRLLVFIVQNRVLLVLLMAWLSIFLLSFLMFVLNETGAAFWRIAT